MAQKDIIFDKDVRMAELELEKIKAQIELAQITTANPQAFIDLELARSKNLATQLEIAKLNSYSGFNSFLIGKF